MGLTVHLDHDIEQRLQEHARASGESPDAIISRALDSVLKPTGTTGAAPSVPFVVKPFDTGLTAEQWKSWGETKIEDILAEAEAPQPK